MESTTATLGTLGSTTAPIESTTAPIGITTAPIGSTTTTLRTEIVNYADEFNQNIDYDLNDNLIPIQFLI